MEKRLLIYIALGLIGILLIVLIFRALERPATLEVTIDPTGEITEGAVLTISDEGFKKSHNLPFQKTVKPGSYEIYVWAEGSNTYSQSFKLRSGQKLNIAVKLTKQGSAGTETVPPYFYLFPHTDTNFEIKAVFSGSKEEKEEFDPNVKIEKLVITPYLAMARDITSEDIQQMKAEYIAEAKSWLKSHGVPEEIPVEIDSLF